MMRRVSCISVLSFVLLSAAAARAQTTKGQISFSGTATGQGTAGSADLTFKLWNAATGGIFVNYSDSQRGVPVNPDDSFSAVLGAGTGGDVPASIFAANAGGNRNTAVGSEALFRAENAELKARLEAVER